MSRESDRRRAARAGASIERRARAALLLILATSSACAVAAGGQQSPTQRGPVWPEPGAGYDCVLTLERYGRQEPVEATAEAPVESEARSLACEQACAEVRRASGVDCWDAASARVTVLTNRSTSSPGVGEVHQATCTVFPFELLDELGQSQTSPLDACASTWARVCPEAGPCRARLHSVEGLPVRAVEQLLAGERPAQIRERPGLRVCELEVEVQGPAVTREHTSATDAQDATTRATQSACQALGLTAEDCANPDRVRHERTSTTVSIANGTVQTTVAVTLRQVTPAVGRAFSEQGMLSACSQALASACGVQGCPAGSIRLVSINRVPLEPPRPPPAQGTDLFGLPVGTSTP